MPYDSFGQETEMHPCLLAHWQAPRAMLKPKPAKELTNPALRTAFQVGFRILPATQNKFVLLIKVSKVR